MCNSEFWYTAYNMMQKMTASASASHDADADAKMQKKVHHDEKSV